MLTQQRAFLGTPTALRVGYNFMGLHVTNMLPALWRACHLNAHLCCSIDRLKISC